MKTRTDIQPAVNIESVILTLRGEKVLPDMDPARIYGVPTKVFNQAVKRNEDRFPSDFMFQLTQKEKDDALRLRSRFVTLKLGRGQHPKYLPYAFTEQGAIMTANVLNSPQAVRMSVFVVRAFVKMRELLGGTKELARQLRALEAKLTARLDGHETAIVDVLQRIMRLLDPSPAPEPPRRQIGFHARPGDETAGATKGRKR
jgi:phage regulator Rha-like protein